LHPSCLKPLAYLLLTHVKCNPNQAYLLHLISSLNPKQIEKQTKVPQINLSQANTMSRRRKGCNIIFHVTKFVGMEIKVKRANEYFNMILIMYIKACLVS
jgi:hypothetical protein